MPWLEQNSSGFYLVCFRVGNQRYKRSLKTRTKKEADGLTARLEENLMLWQRGRLAIPQGADPVSFLLSDGKINGSLPKTLTLRALLKKYFDSVPEGSLEDSTIEGMKIHQTLLEKYLGASFPIGTLTVTDLQTYIQNRSKDKGHRGKVTAGTIKKAIVTLRTVWNWGIQHKVVEGRFPSKGLIYPKSKEKPPFVTFAEAVQRDDPEYWDAVFLNPEEICELLQDVHKNARHSFIFPTFVFAAHTGARRAEIRRAKGSDVDDEAVTLRERKKAHDKRTTRRVPLSPYLKKVLTEWSSGHELLFGPITVREIHHHFKITLQDTKWAKLKGWHCLRHTFISCLAAAGTDQRIIDEFTGHQTEEQRRRYRHLFPNQTKQVIANVFGAVAIPGSESAAARNGK